MITVNPYIAGELAERYNLQKLPTVVMTCAFYQGDIPRQDGFYQKRYAFPAGKKVILYQGLISWGRGLCESAEAMKEVDEAVLAIQGWGGRKRG